MSIAVKPGTSARIRRGRGITIPTDISISVEGIKTTAVEPSTQTASEPRKGRAAKRLDLASLDPQISVGLVGHRETYPAGVLNRRKATDSPVAREPRQNEEPRVDKVVTPKRKHGTPGTDLGDVKLPDWVLREAHLPRS